MCDAKMLEDYDSPRQREKTLNRHMRKINFLKKEWERRSNGNYVLKYKKHLIFMITDRFRKIVLEKSYCK